MRMIEKMKIDYNQRKEELEEKWGKIKDRFYEENETPLSYEADIEYYNDFYKKEEELDNEYYEELNDLENNYERDIEEHYQELEEIADDFLDELEEFLEEIAENNEEVDYSREVSRTWISGRFSSKYFNVYSSNVKDFELRIADHCNNRDNRNKIELHPEDILNNYDKILNEIKKDILKSIGERIW